MFFLLYISNFFSTLLGGLMVMIFIGYLCNRINNSASSKTSYNPPKNYYSGKNYDDSDYSYNWDDSWDDKWLHQGKYADNVNSHNEYSDYGPSWDENFRK